MNRSSRQFLIILFCALSFSFSSHAKNHASYSPFDPLQVTLIDKPSPLSLVVPLDQQAQANSNFYLNFTGFLKEAPSEIVYQVTNHSPTFYFGLHLLALPPGLTPIYQGVDACPEIINLNIMQSCMLRFRVNKSQYASLPGPMICGSMMICGSAGFGSQFDDAVSRLPDPAQVFVTPASLDGLFYDPLTMSIVGTPAKTGDYAFTVHASNNRESTDPKLLTIHAKIDAKDTPVFKSNPSVASAMAGKTYRLHLMDLIKPVAGFGLNNQIRFNFLPKSQHPEWLQIDEKTSVFLQGQVPPFEAGSVKSATLIATSNTGGDSLPLTIDIPVAFDSALKPQINALKSLQGKAGDILQNDFRADIHDPGDDIKLKIVVDKIEPQAPWLGISTSSSTALSGEIPQDAMGQTYYITFHANTTWGGDSEPVTAVLQVQTAANKTPHFYPEKLDLPLLNPGQAYFYDFALNDKVTPLYQEIPYVISFAKGYLPPAWLRIENNQLIAEQVPEDVKEVTEIFVVIKNVPGGESEIFLLKLINANKDVAV